MNQAPQPTDRTAANLPYQPLTFDASKYEGRLESHGLSEKQEAEHLEALWKLVVSFIDLNVPPLSENSCGKVGDSAALPPGGHSKMLCSGVSKTKASFEAAANSALPPKTSQEAS